MGEIAVYASQVELVLQLVTLCYGLSLFIAFTPDFRMLWLFYLVSIVLAGAEYYTGQIKGERNLHLMHIFTIMEFLLLFGLAAYRLGMRQRLRWIIGLGYAFFWVTAKLTFEPFHGADSLTAGLSHLFLFGLVLSASKAPKNPPTASINYSNTALLLYFGGNLFFVSSTFLIVSGTLMTWSFWVISLHLIVNMIVAALHMVSFWKYSPLQLSVLERPCN